MPICTGSDNVPNPRRFGMMSSHPRITGIDRFGLPLFINPSRRARREFKLRILPQLLKELEPALVFDTSQVREMLSRNN